jgi:hypothetical protein
MNPRTDTTVGHRTVRHKAVLTFDKPLHIRSAATAARLSASASDFTELEWDVT